MSQSTISRIHTPAWYFISFQILTPLFLGILTGLAFYLLAGVEKATALAIIIGVGLAVRFIVDVLAEKLIILEAQESQTLIHRIVYTDKLSDGVGTFSHVIHLTTQAQASHAEASRRFSNALRKWNRLSGYCQTETNALINNVIQLPLNHCDRDLLNACLEREGIIRMSVDRSGVEAANDLGYSLNSKKARS